MLLFATRHGSCLLNQNNWALQVPRPQELNDSETGCDGITAFTGLIRG